MANDTIRKQQVLDVVARVGGDVDLARRELPEQVDLVRDGELLFRCGLTPGQLMERLGASP